MRTIYKFPLRFSDDQEVEMPGNPMLFKAGLDPSGGLCIWAIVEPHHAKRKRRFFVVGTGNPVPADAYIWIDTVRDGQFMWHVFTT